MGTDRQGQAGQGAPTPDPHPTPMAPLRYCATPRCPNKVKHGHCGVHQQQKRQVETRYSKGKYGRQWRRAVAEWIAEDPDNRAFCVVCQREGKQVLAEETDHIVPHRGDDVLYWDRTNWQRLCRAHHSRKTAIECGYLAGGDGPNL